MNTLTATGFFLFPAAIIGLPLLIVGSRLLFIALYRVRHGNQPHCRKCDYQLTGMTTEQTCCPECGGNPNDVCTGWRWLAVAAATDADAGGAPRGS